jgi:hypothetical protein
MTNSKNSIEIQKGRLPFFDFSYLNMPYFINAVLWSAFLSLFLLVSVSIAETQPTLNQVKQSNRNETAASSSKLYNPFQLQVYQENTVKPTTLKQATILTQWVIQTLNQQHATVAYIGRNGTRFARHFDKTGMGHGGLVVWNESAQQWTVYQVISDKSAPTYNPKDPRAALFASSIQSFFEGQRQDKLEALVLIPKQQTQDTLQQYFKSGGFQNFFYTDRYDFLARISDTDALNCIKWIYSLVLAAEKNVEPSSIFASPQPSPGLQALRDEMRSRYQYPLYTIPFWERPLLSFVPGARLDRVPFSGLHQEKVASPEGLYFSSLFPLKFFYSGKHILALQNRCEGMNHPSKNASSSFPGQKPPH